MITFPLSFKMNLSLVSFAVFASLLNFSQSYAMEVATNPKKAIEVSPFSIGSQAQRITREYVEARITRANEEDIQALNEVVHIFNEEIYPREGFLGSKMIAPWCIINIMSRCYEDDEFAFYVLCKSFESFYAFCEYYKIFGKGVPFDGRCRGWKGSLFDDCYDHRSGWCKEAESLRNGWGDAARKEFPNFFESIKTRAEKGHAAAQYNLAEFYLKYPNYLKGDDGEVIRLYKLSAGQGHPKAQYSLAEFYQKYPRYLKGDKEEVTRLYKLSADQGHPNAQYEVGMKNLRKDGSIEDAKNGALLLNSAADQGHEWAQYHVGIFYIYGFNSSEKYGLGNYEEALRYLMSTKIACSSIMPKKMVHAFLGAPLSFGEKKYSFDGKKRYPGSFKDMLDHILGEERPDENEIIRMFFWENASGSERAEWLAKNYKPLNNPLKGLVSLVSIHQNKKKNKNNILYPLYTTVADIEVWILECITSIKERSTPGFMIPAFEGGKDEVLKELRNHSKSEGKPPFFAEHVLQLKTDSFFGWFSSSKDYALYSFGEENVVLSNQLMECLEAIDKKWEEADTALKEIALFYQKQHDALKPDQKEFDDHPDVLFCGQSPQSHLIQKAINDIENELCSLENIKNRFKALPYYGHFTRAWEFFDEYEWLK